MLLKEICCQNNSEKCLERQCPDCKDKSISYLDFNSEAEVSYLKWTNKKETYADPKTGQEKNVKKTIKQEIQTTASNIANILENEMKKYLIHENNILHQFRSMKHAKENLLNEEIIIHMDFSENYAFKYSEEAQSVHFGGSREQVTLHTVVVYYKQDTNLTCKCFCTLSESLKHSSPAIWAHLQPVFQHMKRELPNIIKVHFLSDSPSTQYRNKTMFYFFSKLEEELPSIQSATWNYSESGHGKGAPDGVGGVLKRTADRIVAQGADVSNFERLICVLKKHCEGVTLFIVTKEQIAMHEKRVSGLKLTPFRGTFNVHQVGYTRSAPEMLSFRRLSCFKCNATSESCEYRIGDQNFGACEIAKKRKLIEGVAITDLNYGARQGIKVLTCVIYLFQNSNNLCEIT